MKEYKVVIGKEQGLRRKRYMKVIEDGVVSYRNLKEKTYGWGIKYGPYNTIKQKAGSSTWFRVGRFDLEVTEIKELDVIVDRTHIDYGFIP